MDAERRDAIFLLYHWFMALAAPPLYSTQCPHGEPDHVHIFFDAGPETDILDLVRVIKMKTARFARKYYGEALQEHYWKPVFWTDSYFAATVEGATRDMVEQYIRKQGQNKA